MNLKAIFLLLVGFLFCFGGSFAQYEDDLIDSELSRTLDEERQKADDFLEKERQTVSEEEQQRIEEEESAQVSKNLDSALQNYERILQNQPKSQANTLSSRLNENERLLVERQRKLERSQEGLKQAKIQMLTRYLNLKKAYEEGKLTERVFKKKESEVLAEYSYSKRALENDVRYYQSDIDEAQTRINELKEKQKIHKMEYPDIYKPKPKHERNALESLLHGIKKHSRFKIKNAFSKVSRHDVNTPGYNSNYRHMTALYNRAMVAHEMDDFEKAKALFVEYLNIADDLEVKVSEDDLFQAAYLCYLCQDWDPARDFATKTSPASKEELAIVFNDRQIGR